jgi:group I intron endonuclease
MKKAPINYRNGKIYKIVNDVNKRVYIGSTTTSLPRRFTLHKNMAKSRTSAFYNALNEIGIEHFRIGLIQDYPCENKDELETKEFEIMKKFSKKLLYNSYRGDPISFK